MVDVDETDVTDAMEDYEFDNSSEKLAQDCLKDDGNVVDLVNYVETDDHTSIDKAFLEAMVSEPPQTANTAVESTVVESSELLQNGLNNNMNANHGSLSLYNNYSSFSANNGTPDLVISTSHFVDQANEETSDEPTASNDVNNIDNSASNNDSCGNYNIITYSQNVIMLYNQSHSPAQVNTAPTDPSSKGVSRRPGRPREENINPKSEYQRNYREKLKELSKSSLYYIHAVLQCFIKLALISGITLCKSYEKAVHSIALTQKWDPEVLTVINFAEPSDEALNPTLGRRRANDGRNLSRRVYQQQHHSEVGINVPYKLLNEVLGQLKKRSFDEYNDIMTKMERDHKSLYDDLTSSKLRRMRLRKTTSDDQLPSPEAPDKNQAKPHEFASMKLPWKRKTSDTNQHQCTSPKTPVSYPNPLKRKHSISEKTGYTSKFPAIQIDHNLEKLQPNTAKMHYEILVSGMPNQKQLDSSPPTSRLDQDKPPPLVMGNQNWMPLLLDVQTLVKPTGMNSQTLPFLVQSHNQLSEVPHRYQLKPLLSDQLQLNPAVYSSPHDPLSSHASNQNQPKRVSPMILDLCQDEPPRQFSGQHPQQPVPVQNQYNLSSAPLQYQCDHSHLGQNQANYPSHHYPPPPRMSNQNHFRGVQNQHQLKQPLPAMSYRNQLGLVSLMAPNKHYDEAQLQFYGQQQPVPVQNQYNPSSAPSQYQSEPHQRGQNQVDRSQSNSPPTHTSNQSHFGMVQNQHQIIVTPNHNQVEPPPPAMSYRNQLGLVSLMAPNQYYNGAQLQFYGQQQPVPVQNQYNPSSAPSQYQCDQVHIEEVPNQHHQKQPTLSHARGQKKSFFFARNFNQIRSSWAAIPNRNQQAFTSPVIQNQYSSDTQPFGLHPQQSIVPVPSQLIPSSPPCQNPVDSEQPPSTWKGQKITARRPLGKNGASRLAGSKVPPDLEADSFANANADPERRRKITHSARANVYYHPYYSS